LPQPRRNVETGNQEIALLFCNRITIPANLRLPTFLLSSCKPAVPQRVENEESRKNSRFSRISRTAMLFRLCHSTALRFGTISPNADPRSPGKAVNRSLRKR